MSGPLTFPPHSVVLVVDDDERLRGRMALALRERGAEVRTASGVDAATHIAVDLQPTHALVDLRMPDGDGLELVATLVARVPEIRVVVLTGYGSIPTAVEAIRLGALDYLTKPVDADTVVAAFDGHHAKESPADASASTPSLARAEWEHIQRVLHDTDGNISETARRLGLHRRTLQRKLKLNPPRE